MILLFPMSQPTSWDPEKYARNARFVSDLGEPLLELLEPKARELILDLGCGDGALTEKIAASGCTVIGVDASFPQVQAARKKRALPALVMDGHELVFRQRFDAVFSNAALHWMKRPEEVVSRVSDMLRPGGRFVGEFGGEGNVSKIRSALHASLRRRGIDPTRIDPWYYPSVEEYSRLLVRAGFVVPYIELIPRPTKLPGDIVGWLEVFGQPFVHAVPETVRSAFLREVCDELQSDLCHAEGNWIADYVRLRFKAVK
ncbi:MAG TPA: methyltransferase domain-containing protein [Candidatus Binatia bacterium]|nr:methyltransferase domain-containing protein [Candidatus Binatia bacterium]